MAPTLSDLRNTYFGGGSDAEYQALLDFANAGITAGSMLGSGPAIVIPQAGPLGSNTTGWVANRAVFAILPPCMGTYRYFRTYLGAQSGNIQVGVVKLDPLNPLNYTRVMNSGIIACPAVGEVVIDLGATPLGSEQKALFFWADNAVVTAVWTGLAVAGSWGFAKVDGLVTGVLAAGAVTRWRAQEALGCVALSKL